MTDKNSFIRIVYDEEYAGDVDFHQDKQQEKTVAADGQKSEEAAVCKFHVGDKILHPAFGEGTVADVKHLDKGIRVSVHFKCGEKTLSAKWLEEHCRQQ